MTICCGQISTQKIKVEISKDNSAIEIDHGVQWHVSAQREIIAVGRIEVTLGFVDHFT